MDISVINISKGPFDFNKEAVKDLDLNKVSLDVTPRLRYSKESDYLGYQIDLIITQEKIQILKGGFLIGFAIKDWSKDLKAGLDLNKEKEKLFKISKTAWLVATGIVAMQTSFDQFNGIILPTINYEDLGKEVILIQV